MGRKIGLFFFLVGILGMILFFLTFQIGESEWALGFISLLSLAIGILLIIKRRPPPKDVERFRSYRGYRSRKDDKKEK